jgi:phosphoribosylaminoimidazole-succinocarboxamide synthase
VRDIYDLGDALLIVATDRISAFDCVMPNGIPEKGRILTQLSLFWFDKLKDIAANHLLSSDPAALPDQFAAHADALAGRCMWVRKLDIVPIECVVRGYLAGSGWKQYQQSRAVCGVALPEGLNQCARLPKPIFTPTTKEQSGHDVPVTGQQVAEQIGGDLAGELEQRSIALYQAASEYAADRGVIIADTKFEWGLADGELVLADEIFTPDSSRFWPADQYEPGRDQVSFDKQFVRNYLETCDWDKTPPAPELPADIVARTREKYVEAYERLTGRKFE